MPSKKVSLITDKSLFKMKPRTQSLEMMFLAACVLSAEIVKIPFFFLKIPVIVEAAALMQVAVRLLVGLAEDHRGRKLCRPREALLNHPPARLYRY